MVQTEVRRLASQRMVFHVNKGLVVWGKNLTDSITQSRSPMGWDLCLSRVAVSDGFVLAGIVVGNIPEQTHGSNMHVWESLEN